MSRQSHAAKFDAFPIRDNPIGFDGFVRGVVAPIEVPVTSVHHQLPVKLAGEHLRTSSALEFCEPATMIVMSVTVQQDFHVLHLEAKLLDVCRDLRQHLDGTSVQKNVSCRGHNEERTDQVSAHIINVPDNFPWFEWTR